MDRVEELRAMIVEDRCKDLPTWEDVAILLCRLDDARDKAIADALEAVDEVIEESSTATFQLGVRAAHAAIVTKCHC